MILSLALAACSTTDLGGTGIGLSGFGSANLTPVGTPTTQGHDPGGTYAFVYGNQVWIKTAQDKTPRQLTHLALAAGTSYSWGPIVWSADGTHLAFALGQSDQTATPATSGPLYIVDTSHGDAQLTAGTSSVFGHAYAWYGTSALFYANGAGIQFYDFSAPGDPRAFNAVVGSNGPDYSQSNSPHFVTFGDIAFLGQRLYATRIDVAALGGTGAIGTAKVWSYFVPTAAGDYAGGSMGLSRFGLSGFPAVDLGKAYADGLGNVVAGGWNLAQDGGVAFDQVTGVDAKTGTVKSTVCYAFSYDFGGCDYTLFQDVSSFPVDARPQLAFSTDGKTIAFGGPSVSTEGRTGSAFAKLSPGAVGQPPQWSPDDASLAATQPPAASSSSASQQSTTNIVIYAGGKSSVFVAGAEGLTWAP
ncbi:MAG: hypothetical protein ACHQ4H_18275 [Ktedonobacterales bacterium]